MRLLGIDFETTGLDTGKDRVIEVGMVLWDTDTRTPLLSFSQFVYDGKLSEHLTPESEAMMLRVCGITRKLLHEFGVIPEVAFGNISRLVENHHVDYFVAHNGENFDKPFLFAELTRHGINPTPISAIPWIDTRMDIPFDVEPDSRKLKHLALDCGFINPFPHRAVFDVLTMLKVLSHYPLEKVIAYSKIPFITIRAMVEYQDRELAKARRFSWEKIGDRTYTKKWVKRIKQDQLEKERAESPFKIIQLEGE